MFLIKILICVIKITKEIKMADVILLFPHLIQNSVDAKPELHSNFL